MYGLSYTSYRSYLSDEKKATAEQRLRLYEQKKPYREE